MGSGTTFQQTQGHFRMKVGACPFCRHDSAHLWCEPDAMFEPFQVRCALCGAPGPWCDTGEGTAIPAWQSVEPKPRAPTPSRQESKGGERD